MPEEAEGRRGLVLRNRAGLADACGAAICAGRACGLRLFHRGSQHVPSLLNESPPKVLSRTEVYGGRAGERPCRSPGEGIVVHLPLERDDDRSGVAVGRYTVEQVEHLRSRTAQVESAQVDQLHEISSPICRYRGC